MEFHLYFTITAAHVSKPPVTPSDSAERYLFVHNTSYIMFALQNKIVVFNNIIDIRRTETMAKIRICSY